MSEQLINLAKFNAAESSSATLLDSILAMTKRDPRTKKGKVRLLLESFASFFRLKRQPLLPQQNVLPDIICHLTFTLLQLFKGSFGLIRPKKKPVNPYTLPKEPTFQIPPPPPGWGGGTAASEVALS